MKASGLAMALLAASPALAENVCHEIDSRAGWQTAEFPVGLVQGIHSTGFWTVAPGLTRAGTQGHGGMDGKDLDGRAESRPFPSALHGALLVRFDVAGKAQLMDWARFHAAIEQAGAFQMNLGEIEFRINEGDADLADNAGLLTICFRYTD